ncbi:histidine phosphatase family protein [Clostridium boliviensis]|uniref:Histidine phosphatase family protein n=1 Tax=Clostridium boliviensis TaxID=318465 RepID=A0ABU4GM02_9CLOT|nr:histidine phosphatase family protein [Clostridium boliviensis]MDW2798646.1 histidine phosphatase family protein [Clostridium boliviensis]
MFCSACRNIDLVIYGESLRDIQERNIKALTDILREYKDEAVVIGAQGTALSTVIHYYDQSFGFAEFQQIRNLMPWIVKFTFEAEEFMGIDLINIL